MKNILFVLLAVMINAEHSSNPKSAVFDFDSAKGKMADFEKGYEESYQSGEYRYYGRYWKEEYASAANVPGTQDSLWKHYEAAMVRKGQEPRQLDCTLYAQAIMKAGMKRQDYLRLLSLHRKIWPGRGLAGWSIAHLLTEYFGWTGYAFIEPGAEQYGYYLSHFKNKNEYPVWRQPNVRIKKYFILKDDNSEVEKLLRSKGFGWGFSEGGIHTWVVDGMELKECHYECAPSIKYEVVSGCSMFETTPFLEFDDYDVHLIVFPPTS